MCDCGCNTCDKTMMLNESLVPKEILSEGLKYHMDNNKPLTEHLYRAGSDNYFNLWAEARSLYSRGILEIQNEDDLAVLTETDLGHFGMFEGKKVPLDFPIELTEEETKLFESEETKLLSQILSTLQNMDQGGEDREKDIESLHGLLKQLDTSMDYVASALTGKGTLDISTDQDIYGKLASPKNVKEAAKKKKKDNRPIGKPMRSSSGGKAYKVYVRDPKTKKVKTVRFGSGGLRAKINDPKARQAFAKRHKCSTKKDRTKASYWSCRLPRYAKLLGLKSSFSGFW